MALEEIIKAFRDIDIDYSAYYMSLLNNIGGWDVIQ